MTKTAEEVVEVGFDGVVTANAKGNGSDVVEADIGDQIGDL